MIKKLVLVCFASLSLAAVPSPSPQAPQGHVQQKIIEGGDMSNLPPCPISQCFPVCPYGIWTPYGNCGARIESCNIDENHQHWCKCDGTGKYGSDKHTLNHDKY